MHLDDSAFLSECKPTLRRLLSALTERFSYASVLAADANCKSYHVSRSGVFCGEGTRFSGRGFVIRVHDGKGYAEYSFNELSDGRIPGIVSLIAERLVPMGEGFPIDAFTAPPESPARLSASAEVALHPAALGDEKILSRLSKLREKILSEDERLVDATAYASFREYHEYYLSDAREMEQNEIWTEGMIAALALKDGEVKEYFDTVSGNGGIEILDGLEEKIPYVARSVVELLTAEPIEPGEYDCIVAPDLSGMIAHEAFGHGVEMDMFVKDRALARSYIGQQIASPLVTMHDGGAAASQTATFAFDNEGTPAGDTLVIDRGILVRGICDALSARALGVEPTGNGRRESYKRKAYTRMTNTFFEGGTDSLEDMISSINYGFFLENPSSGMEDPKNWGIQCIVNVAREIKDGKLTGRVFSPIILSGYVPDLLKSISMMTPTVKLAGSGYCGKGYKEYVKVSDGGPYLKARIRLG